MAVSAERLRQALAGARIVLGAILSAFGFWELTAPSQWSGYVPAAVGARIPAVPLVLVHGWVLFVLGVCLAVHLRPRLTGWLSVAVLTEVVLGLIGRGDSAILVRDLGLLALGVVVAMAESVQESPATGAAASAKTRTVGGRVAARVR